MSADETTEKRRCSAEGCSRANYGRGWCHMHWQRWRKTGDPLGMLSPQRPDRCVVVDCGKPANGGRGWCKKHYTRWERHGSPLGSLIQRRGTLTSHGYLVMHRPDHPLASSHGKVYEHRFVLYAVIGPGAHPCSWCGVPVTWMVDLVVDHVDENTRNNTPSNLVPSCHPCNANRARRGDGT